MVGEIKSLCRPWQRDEEDSMHLDNNVLIGMPTLIELKSLKENIDLCNSLQLSLIELNMNLPYLQLENLKDIYANGEIQYSIHLPEELNIWDYNEKVKNAYLETLDAVIEISLRKKIEIINMHMNEGIYFTLPGEKRYLYEEDKSRYIDATQEVGEKINSELKNTDLKICIENTGVLNNRFIEEAVELLLGYDGFRLTWDIGHDFSSGDNDKNYYLKNIDKIIHLHLHDAVGDKNHLPLGTGEIDIKNIMALTENKVKSIILETKTVAGLEKSVEYYREEFGRNL